MKINTLYRCCGSFLCSGGVADLVMIYSKVLFGKVFANMFQSWKLYSAKFLSVFSSVKTHIKN